MTEPQTHTHDEGWYEKFPLPVLLELARRPFRLALRTALDAAGFDDLPRMGSRLIGGIARKGTGMSEFPGAIGRSKQATSQLVDTLVARGYVERVPDTVDRRRMTLTLTERGTAVASVIRATMQATDAGLVAELGPDAVASMRAALGRLADLGMADADS